MTKIYKCEKDNDQFELEMKVYTPEMKEFCKEEGNCQGVMDINDIRDNCLEDSFGCHAEYNNMVLADGIRDMPKKDNSDPRNWAANNWIKIIEEDERLMKEAKDMGKKKWKQKLENDKKLMEQAKIDANQAWGNQQNELKNLEHHAKKQAKKERAKHQKKQEAKKEKKDDGPQSL